MKAIAGWEQFVCADCCAEVYTDQVPEPPQCVICEYLSTIVNDFERERMRRSLGEDHGASRH